MKLARIWTLVILCAAFALKAQAVEVQPAIIELQGDPGNGKQAYIHLTNDENQNATFQVTVQKFIPSGQHGQQEFLPPDDTSGLPDWTFVDAPSVTLKPGQSVNFPVSFRIPASAAAGTYTEAIFFSLASDAGQGNVATTPRIGALIFYTINGALVEKQILDSFSTDKTQYLSVPVELSAVVKNDGNVVTTPTGTVSITNVFGNKVAEYPVNPMANRVLPGSSRDFHFALTDAWAFGPYRATITLNKTVPEQMGVTVYVWSLKWLEYGLGGLAVLILGYFLLKRFIIARATR